MMVTDNGYLMMLFVQKRISEGLEPDADGYYMIRRKEFLDRLGMSPSSFAGQIQNLVHYYMQQWDLYTNFRLDGLQGENLFTDISYKKGVLKFKRNPYTMRSELSYVWGREPKYWEERQFRYETVPVPNGVMLPIMK